MARKKQKTIKDNGLSILITLPHGLYLPAGVTTQVDKNKAEALAVQTCDDKGCYAGAALQQALLENMKKGEALVVGFQDLKKQSITLSLPLRGFADAYQKMP